MLRPKRNRLLRQQRSVLIGDQGRDPVMAGRGEKQVDGLAPDTAVLPSTVTERGSLLIPKALPQHRGRRPEAPGECHGEGEVQPIKQPP